MLFTKKGVSTLHAWTHENVRVLTPSQFTQQIPGFGQPSVRDRLAHILAVLSGWIRRLQELTSENWELSDFPDLHSLAAAKRRVVSATQAYLQGLEKFS